MRSIKEIDAQIQIKQRQMDAAQAQADKDRERADQFRNDDQIGQAEAEAHAAMKYQQEATRLQDEMDALNSERQQVEQEIMKLQQQRDGIIDTKNREANALNDQIVRLRGSY